MTPHASTLDQITRDFREAFATLRVDELNWRPAANSWSIAQHLDHLVRINRTYFPILDQLHAGTYQVPFYGKWGWYHRMMGHFILQSVKPESKKKIRTFPIWEPRQSQIAGDIVERFAAHQEELKERMAAARELVERGALVASPANRAIVYSLGTAFEIIVEHEKRHLLHARAVKAGLPVGPGAE
ncbi:MAG: DinB family protein [Bacteroidota bacterium]